MVLRRRFAFIVATTLLLPFALRAQDKPRPGEVTLSLKDYLTLVEAGEKTQRERTAAQAQRELPVAEVTAQRMNVVLGKDDAEVASEFEVLVQGSPVKPVLLPLAGYAAQAEVRAAAGGTGGAAVTAIQGGGGVVLLAPAAGKYTVRVAARMPFDGADGVQRLAFAPVAAPVAATEVDLAAELAWTCAGAVVVEDRIDNGRRHVKLAARRSEGQVLEVRRKVDSVEAEKLLASTVVLTLFQLRPEGTRRHDVILYEVARGSLGSFTVELPPGLEVEQAGTDEGAVVPVAEGETLTIHRQHQLQGVGYLVLTSTPSEGVLAKDTPLALVRPAIASRLRYLALSSSVAADARPLPEASWARVDLTDLPAALSEALAALELTAAWRMAGDGSGTSLAVDSLPPAATLEATVLLRETTTLMTVDGTLLYRDRFTLESRSRSGASFDVALPAGATLWSAKLDEQPVRPLERGGTVSVPLGFESGARAVVEIVAVLDRAIPPGRSQLALDLPQVRLPVRDHRWKLLLPEGPRYRFRRGELRPFVPPPPPVPRGRADSNLEEEVLVTAEPPLALQDARKTLQNAPSVLTDRINVGGNESGQQSSYFGAEAQDLKMGLVGGVKPLPISIPESSKVLLLTGVLPPQRVTVELEVKAKR
jgi:hypothetical protein